MSKRLTLEDSRQALRDHIAEKGVRLREAYGPVLDWTVFQRILEDRRFVRYPCRAVFDIGPLQPGEFAYPAPQGALPEEGFVLYIHPAFAARREEAVAMALYQLAAVNYGSFAGSGDAEAFGAAALGWDYEEYYRRLCAWSDEVGGEGEPAAAAGCGCGSGGCGGGG